MRRVVVTLFKVCMCHFLLCLTKPGNSRNFAKPEVLLRLFCFYCSAGAVTVYRHYITYPVLILSYSLYYTPELHSLFCWCSHCVHTLHYLSCTDPELHPVLYSRAALTILQVESLCIYITYPVLILSYILYYTPELRSLFCWCSHCVHTLLILY